MTILLIIHSVLTLLGTGAVFALKSTPQAVSFLAGALVSLLNIAAIVYTIPRIMAKKQVALSTAVIVFKFAIFGWIIYEVVRGEYLQILWFAAGLALVLPAVVITGLNVSTNIAEKAES